MDIAGCLVRCQRDFLFLSLLSRSQNKFIANPFPDNSEFRVDDTTRFASPLTMINSTIPKTALAVFSGPPSI
jgi:hypothetical protein